jgi:hypothetical protein
MGKVGALNAISSGNAIVAASVSDNFDACVSGINTVENAQLASNCVLSSNISNNAIIAAKISGNQILQAALQFNSGSGGVQVERIGTAPPVNGLMMARYSNTFAIDSVASGCSASAIVSWNQAIDGNPAYTTTPIMAGIPMVALGNTATDIVAGIDYSIVVQSINSEAVSFQYNVVTNAGTVAITATAHFAAHGAV